MEAMGGVKKATESKMKKTQTYILHVYRALKWKWAKYRSMSFSFYTHFCSVLFYTTIDVLKELSCCQFIFKTD